MKIAVQLFGHLRNFESCAQALQKHLLSRYDCDVFIHCWDETEHTPTAIHPLSAPIRQVDENMIKKIRHLYHPKSLKVEPQDVTRFPPLEIPWGAVPEHQTISSVGIRYMIYSETAVNTLRQTYQQKHPITYDYVLMIRPDVLLKKDLDLEAIQAEITSASYPDVRYAAAFMTAKNCLIYGDMVSDALFFARPPLMDKIISAYNQINFTAPDFKIWNPETLLTKTLLMSNIATLYINYPYLSAWELNRQFSKSRLLRIHLKSNGLYLHLFCRLPYPILSLNCLICNFFKIEIYLGMRLN